MFASVYMMFSVHMGKVHSYCTVTFYFQDQGVHFMFSTAAFQLLAVKGAGMGRMAQWLRLAEFYYRVWQLTPRGHTFNIPLPTVNSFYNQVALTQTQRQY